MNLANPKLNRKHLTFLAFALMLIFGSYAFAQETNKPQKLLPNKPIERSIKGGETHVFEMELKKGEYARMEVEQKNIDVIVSLQDADGKTLIEMDGKDSFLWHEAVSAMSGNGKESEGFAYLAQSLGAKTVLASLWKVSDEGTPELMIRFYTLRSENPTMSKGEAFRQAQLSLLNGEQKVAIKKVPKVIKKGKDGRGVETFQIGENKVKLSLYETTGKAKFAHPYYWASFVLIGNWK